MIFKPVVARFEKKKKKVTSFHELFSVPYEFRGRSWEEGTISEYKRERGGVGVTKVALIGQLDEVREECSVHFLPASPSVDLLASLEGSLSPRPISTC